MRLVLVRDKGLWLVDENGDYDTEFRLSSCDNWVECTLESLDENRDNIYTIIENGDKFINCLIEKAIKELGVHDASKS